MDILCKVDFNKWNDSKIIITDKDNKIRISNDFFTVDLNYSNKVKDKYFYSHEFNILIFYHGILLKNNFESSLFDRIIKDYLRNDKTFANNLSGFFSLTIIDFVKRKVLLVSDKVGQLRLYFSFNNNLLIFSNTLIRLSDQKTTTSKEGLSQFILINYYIDEQTIFKQISRTLPGTVVFFQKDKKPYKEKYFDLFNHLIYLKDEQFPLEEIAGILKKIINDYTEGKGSIITLTSGFDSRLLLASVLSTSECIDAFTFGVNENFEFKVAETITNGLNINVINKINYEKIFLEKEFEEIITSYFQYIKTTKNISLNFNRFHYVFVWNKLKKIFDPTKNILTGLCGDSFLRDGFENSYQTNELLLNLINNFNKPEAIRNFINKKTELIEKAGLEKNFCYNYLNAIFNEFKENDKHFNHILVKIRFSINNYFGSEVNTENFYISTFPVFLDIRYLEGLVKSGYSIFSVGSLTNPNKYKMKSHQYYFRLINILYDKLNHYTTNRGFPLKYSSSNLYLPLRIISNLRLRMKGYKLDLDYEKWKSFIKVDLKNDLTFEDSMKLKVLSEIN